MRSLRYHSNRNAAQQNRVENEVDVVYQLLAAIVDNVVGRHDKACFADLRQHICWLVPFLNNNLLHPPVDFRFEVVNAFWIVASENLVY